MKQSVTISNWTGPSKITVLIIISSFHHAPNTSAFSLPIRSVSVSRAAPTLFSSKKDLFFADEVASTDRKDGRNNMLTQLFSEETLRDANDALSNVGWSGVPPSSPFKISEDEMGELTSDDPFVKEIDEAIQREMGVSLDELLNPAKVVNLERDLFNLRTEIAALTKATIDSSLPLATQNYDAGGGGDDVSALRSKISKKEKDLQLERRSVFRGWLKSVFLGQAVFSAVLSYVMATAPDTLFSSFDWYNNVSNMDTSISVLGFWWWWLFIVPSLRSRRPSGWEKDALDMAFLGTPVVSLLSPVATKDTGAIWLANFVVVVASYGVAYFSKNRGGDGGMTENDEGVAQQGWLKFVFKSLDFGSGRERGVRK